MEPLNRKVLLWVVLAAVVWIPAPIAAATPTVTFTGTPVLNLGVLSCPSSPNVAELTVAAGVTVAFVNQTGKPANLHVGAASSSVPAGGLHSVRFDVAGQMQVSMVPKCLLDTATHGTMTVTVCAAADVGSPPAKPTPTGTAAKPRTFAAVNSDDPGPATHPATVHSSPARTAAGAIGAPVAGGRSHTNQTLVLIAAVALICVSVVWVNRVVQARR